MNMRRLNPPCPLKYAEGVQVPEDGGGDDGDDDETKEPHGSLPIWAGAFVIVGDAADQKKHDHTHQRVHDNSRIHRKLLNNGTAGN